MQNAWWWLAVSTLVYLILTLAEFIIGFAQIKNLSAEPIAKNENFPFLSIIFSALNEEKEIENTVLSLLNLNYPNFEVIAVNDRSTDQTGQILDRLQQQFLNLHVYHLNHLPDQWFGKNHALYVATRRAKGKWLLFTDADVEMKQDTLLKAISYSLRKQLDHLTICEYHVRPNWGLKILLLGHYISYSIAMKPWRIRFSWSKKSLGHGAFNLVKRSAYKACLGHQAIAMECLDDLKLGHLLKSNGFKQDTVDGRDYVQRAWYGSLSEMINGWKKNSFAYYDYQILPTLRDMILATLFYFCPFFVVIFYPGPLRLLNVINILLTLILSMYVASQFRLAKRDGFFYPLAILLIIYTIGCSLFTVLKNNGVVWRGTFYPLSNIKPK